MIHAPAPHAPKPGLTPPALGLRLQRQSREGCASGLLPGVGLTRNVLAESGHSLSVATRAFMEPRFGRDFSAVRVHTGEPAARSARSLNALAYTVGDHLVFDQGQYTPGTATGNRLLAHELTHVVQQRGSHPNLQEKLKVEAPGTVAEREADTVAEQVIHGQSARVAQKAPPAIMRTLRVEEADQPVPTPNPNGPTPTRAAAIEGYLQQLAPQGGIQVHRSSGMVSATGEFCQSRGFFGRLGRGLASGFQTGARIGAYALGVGAIPGAILGALIGGIAGIFGSDSQAEESSTPTGSTCVCDFINGRNPWTIRVSDQETPLTGDTFVRVTGPYSPRAYGAATVSGRLDTVEPWLALGHELCGHAWLQEHHQDEDIRPGVDALHHHRTVDRENLLRQEHGLEARGYHLRDPYCGESFHRDRATPGGPATGPEHFQPLHPESDRPYLTSIGREHDMDETYLDECQQQREQYLGDLAHRYRVEQRIPEGETP